MRVESKHPVHNGGWFHPFGDVITAPVKRFVAPEPPKPTINASKLILDWAESTQELALETFASSLGVSAEALASLNAVWASQHSAWAFPMRDGHGNAVGIRLRAEDGSKWAVRGSKQGIFLPEADAQQTVYLCEGPTDTAAALTLGLYAMGRPSCNCGGPEIRTACARLKIKRAVIVSDNDTPGLRGAEKIASELTIPTTIYVPPTKDLREFLNLGGTKAEIENTIKNFVWRRP